MSDKDDARQRARDLVHDYIYSLLAPDRAMHLEMDTGMWIPFIYELYGIAGFIQERNLDAKKAARLAELEAKERGE